MEQVPVCTSFQEQISDDDNLAVRQPGKIVATVMSGQSLSLLPQAQTTRSQLL